MPKLSERKSLEQRRAERAYKFAAQGKKLSEKGKDVDKAYKSYVKKIPMLIKTNGLGATFAFVKAKSDKKPSTKGYAYHKIYQQITEWLKERMPYLQDEEGKKLSEPDLVYIIISQNSDVYRQITVEVLAFFSWLKRFSEGLIEGEDVD